MIMRVCVGALCSHAPAGRPPVCAPRSIPMTNLCFCESLHVCVSVCLLTDSRITVPVGASVTGVFSE